MRQLKTTTALLLWSALCASPALAGITPQTLMGVQYLSASTLLAVGTSGTQFRSTDGGTTWTQEFPWGTTNNTLRSLSFADSSTGIAVVMSGGTSSTSYIYKTTNGGASWDLKYTSPHVLQGSDVLNASIMSVVGKNGSILRSDDGGESWHSQASGALPDQYGYVASILGIDLVDGLTGFASGELVRVYKTTTGGSTWSPMQVNPTGGQLFDVAFWDASRGVTVGVSGNAYYTNDGGGSWTQRSVGQNAVLNAVATISSQCALAAGQYGTLSRTCDGGNSWSVRTSGVGATFFDVDFFDANRGVAVGTAGTVLLTNDGGLSWFAPGTTPPPPATLQPSFAVSPSALNFGKVKTGNCGTAKLTVTNAGTAALTVSGILSNNAAFKVSPSSLTVNPGTGTFVYVTFKPTARIAYSGTLTFTHNASASPTYVNVSGSGSNRGGLTCSALTLQSEPVSPTILDVITEPLNDSPSANLDTAEFDPAQNELPETNPELQGGCSASLSGNANLTFLLLLGLFLLRDRHHAKAAP